MTNPLAGLLTLNKLVADLQGTAQQIANEALVSRGAGWIRQLRVEFPFAYNLLMTALYKEPEDVLRALAQMDPTLIGLDKNEFARDYVARIQLKIRGEQS